MSSGRFLIRYRANRHAFHSIFTLSSSSSSSSHQHRSISSTCHLGSGWMDKIKGVFTGKEPPSEPQPPASPESLTLLRFADDMKTSSLAAALKKLNIGRFGGISGATFGHAFEKQEAIIRHLGALDATGENLQSSQKQSAAQHCNCTIADVENALAKFTWAREVHEVERGRKANAKKLGQAAKVQKLMGSTPLDLARTNMAKSGQISRNTPCPCGSKKKYKWFVSVFLLFSLWFLKSVKSSNT